MTPYSRLMPEEFVCLSGHPDSSLAAALVSTETCEKLLTRDYDLFSVFLCPVPTQHHGKPLWRGVGAETWERAARCRKVKPLSSPTHRNSLHSPTRVSLFFQVMRVKTRCKHLGVGLLPWPCTASVWHVFTLSDRDRVPNVGWQSGRLHTAAQLDSSRQRLWERGGGRRRRRSSCEGKS